MALQVGCLVCNDSIADGVCLVESIVGKINDLVVNRLCDGFRDTMGNCTGDILLRIAIDKDLALRLNDLHLFLGNGPADIICLTHGIAT